jgi:hypothetical protein
MCENTPSKQFAWQRRKTSVSVHLQTTYTNSSLIYISIVKFLLSSVEIVKNFKGFFHKFFLLSLFTENLVKDFKWSICVINKRISLQTTPPWTIKKYIPYTLNSVVLTNASFRCLSMMYQVIGSEEAVSSAGSETWTPLAKHYTEVCEHIRYRSCGGEKYAQHSVRIVQPSSHNISENLLENTREWKI